jgi:predicted unusual protein kinase regulating ubiquinone biosynthesis (AarF/ABC1/UbiB family)
VIPKVFTRYSNRKVLVQCYEESESLSNVSSWSDFEKKQAAPNWISYFVESLLNKNWIHGDLHGANYGFRRDHGELVLYDFGAVLEHSETQRRGLIQFLRAVAQGASTKVRTVENCHCEQSEAISPRLLRLRLAMTGKGFADNQR